MIKDRLLTALLLCVFVAPITTYADLPLTIEDLLTAERRWRADVNLVYANIDRRDVESLFTTIQLGPGQFINVPVSVTQARQNTDILALSIGLRYGMSLNTEIYSRISGVYQNYRTLNAEGASSDRDQKFTDAWLGINHRFSEDNETPALLGFAEVALAENVAGEGTEFEYGKAGMAGITTYRAIDPLVLSLTTGYRYSSELVVQNQSIDTGDIFFINPSIAFAVNHEVTMTSGLQWRWQQQDSVDNQDQGIRTTQTKMEFGMGYAWSKRTTLQIISRADITGDSGAEISMTFLYKFPSHFSKKHEEKGGETVTEEKEKHMM